MQAQSLGPPAPAGGSAGQTNRAVRRTRASHRPATACVARRTRIAIKRPGQMIAVQRFDRVVRRLAAISARQGRCQLRGGSLLGPRLLNHGPDLRMNEQWPHAQPIADFK